MVLKKIILKILIFHLLFSGVINNFMNVYGITISDKPINASVLLYTYKDKYISEIKEELEKIENNNKDKISFNFYDANKSQELQNKQLEEVLKNGTDIILLSMVDIGYDKYLVDKIKEENIPVIFFNREPFSLVNIKSYGKAVFVGNDSEEAGILQGEIITELWKKNKKIFDRNDDNILQYILIKGEKNNLDAKLRSEYVIKTINKNGVDNIEIASEFCNWDRDIAKNRVKSLLLQYGNSIEAIICNNDEMAIGSVIALEEFGYSSKEKVIIVGIDGTEEAINLIKQGKMSGTVVQQPYKMSDALYKISINVVEGKQPLENTGYSFDSSGIGVRIPYTKYIINEQLLK